MIQIVITLSDEGQLTITGPIQNKVLTYGILELAKDVVRAQQLKPPDIVVPTHIIPPVNGGSQPA